MIYGGLQALDAQGDVWVIREFGGSLGMGQRQLSMRDHERGVPHPTVADCLLAVVHSHADVDGDLEVRHALADPSSRDLNSLSRPRQRVAHEKLSSFFGSPFPS